MTHSKKYALIRLLAQKGQDIFKNFNEASSPENKRTELLSLLKQGLYSVSCVLERETDRETLNRTFRVSQLFDQLCIAELIDNHKPIEIQRIADYGGEGSIKIKSIILSINTEGVPERIVFDRPEEFDINPTKRDIVDIKSEAQYYEGQQVLKTTLIHQLSKFKLFSTPICDIKTDHLKVVTDYLEVTPDSDTTISYDEYPLPTSDTFSGAYLSADDLDDIAKISGHRSYMG